MSDDRRGIDGAIGVSGWGEEMIGLLGVFMVGRAIGCDRKKKCCRSLDRYRNRVLYWLCSKQAEETIVTYTKNRRQAYDVLLSTALYTKERCLDGSFIYLIVANEFAGVVDVVCPVRKIVTEQRAKMGIQLVLAKTKNITQAKQYVKKLKAAGAVATIDAISFLEFSM